MSKGIHRVAAGTKRARQMNTVGKTVDPFRKVDPEIEAWNKRVEERKHALQTIPQKESK